MSQSSTTVTDLALATDGDKVAAAWSQNLGPRTQVYLREFSSSTWNDLGGSTSGNGLSGTTGRAMAASLAYLNHTLFAAWQDNTSGHDEILAAKFDGNNWIAAGTGSNTGSGVSSTHGNATQPQLSANGGALFLLWLDDRLANFTGNTTGVYVKRWNGIAFQEEIVGDASYRGIADMVAAPQTPALSVDTAGHPYTTWMDTSSGQSEIYMRGNKFDVGTVHYVNDGDPVDGDALANAYTTAPGSDANDGLSPGSPKLSLQAVLDDAAHPVQPGDVVLVDAGNYPTPTFLGASGNGLLILGSPSEPAVMAGTIAATNTTNLTLDHLNITGGFWSSGGSNLTVIDNTVQGSGLTINGGAAAQIVGNLAIPSGAGITLQGAAVNPSVEHNRITGGRIGIVVTGAGATGVEVRDNRIIGAGTA